MQSDCYTDRAWLRLLRSLHSVVSSFSPQHSTRAFDAKAIPDESGLIRSEDSPGSMTAGIKQWVSQMLAAVQQQHDMEDLRNLLTRHCSGAGMKAALDHCLSDVDTLQVRQSTIL